jgi:hypothetical protein
MYTAKEARERALDISNDKYQKELGEIDLMITKAIKEGNFSITLFKMVHSTVIDELKRLEYKVDTLYDKQDQAYNTVISW